MSFKKFSEEVAPRVHATVLTTLAGCPEEVVVKKLEAEVMAELRDNWFRIRTHKVAVRRAYAERVAGTMSRGLRRRRLDDNFKRYYPTALGLVETVVARVLSDWRSDVPDVVSTAMLNLWIHRDSIPEDPDTRRAYVIITAKRTSYSHIRTMKRRAVLLETYGVARTMYDAGHVEAPTVAANLSCRVPEECEVKAVALALAGVTVDDGLAAPPRALVEFVECRVREVVEWIDARAARDRRFPRERIVQTLVMGLQAIQQLAISKQFKCSASIVCHYVKFLIELFEDDDPPPDKPLRSKRKANTETAAREPGRDRETQKPPPPPTSSLDVFMLAIELIHECLDACEREDVLSDLGLEVHAPIPGELVRLESSAATQEAAPPVRHVWVNNEPLELEKCELFEERFEEYLHHPFLRFYDAETDPSWCGGFVSIEDHGGQCDSSDDRGERRRSAVMSQIRYAMTLRLQPELSSVGTPCGDDGLDPGSLGENCHGWGYERHPPGVYVREEDFAEHSLPVLGMQLDSRMPTEAFIHPRARPSQASLTDLVPSMWGRLVERNQEPAVSFKPPTGDSMRQAFEEVVADLNVLLEAPIDYACDGLLRFGQSEKIDKQGELEDVNVLYEDIGVDEEENPFLTVHGQDRIVALDIGQMPESITTDEYGNIYLSMGTTVGKITPSGQLITFALPVPDGSFVTGLKFDEDGHLCAATAGFTPDPAVALIWRRISPSGQHITEYAEIGPKGFPNDLAFDDDGNLYVTDPFLGQIWNVDDCGDAEVWLEDSLLDPNVENPYLVISPFGVDGIAFDKNLDVGDLDYDRILCAIITVGGDDQIPRSLSGRDSDRLDVLLESFGMIGVELMTMGGELLSALIDTHQDPDRGEYRKDGEFILSKDEHGRNVATTYTDGDLSWVTTDLMLDKPRCYIIRVVDVATRSTVQSVEFHANVPGVAPIGCDESSHHVISGNCGCQLVDTGAPTQEHCGANVSEGCSSAAAGWLAFMCDEWSILWLLGGGEFLPEFEIVDAAWSVDETIVIDFITSDDCFGGAVAEAPTGDRPFERVSSARTCDVGVTDRGRPRHPSLVTNCDECVRLRARWRERTFVAGPRRTMCARTTRAWGRWGRPERSARAEQPLYGPLGDGRSPASSPCQRYDMRTCERAVREVWS